MFASAALARRIEAQEVKTTLGLGHTVARRRAPEAIVRELGAGAAVWSGVDSPGDKVIGLGWEPFDVDAFARFEADVLARGGTVRVEHASLADPEVGRILTTRGYELVGYENVLGARPAARAAPAHIDVRLATDDAGIAAWMDSVATGFSFPDAGDGAPRPTESFGREALELVARDMNEVTGLRRYVAWRDGVVAGGAAMRADAGLAMLAGAATLPAHRRHGVQTALLAARLADAVALECDVAVITTGPGTKSCANAIKNGFALLYVRAVLVKS
jgi:hypothetical protein